MKSFKSIVLRTDQSFVVKEVLNNSINGLVISKGQNIVSLFDESSHQTFFDIISSEIKPTELKLVSINNDELKLYKLIDNQDFIFILILTEDKISFVMDELLRINYDQNNQIIDLKKQLESFSNYNNLVEETMRLNNELINIKRRLSIENNRLEKGNLTDSLTEIPNRRKFFQDVYEFVKSKDYYLYLLDIDNFKAVNDDLGHTKGDEVLVLLSKFMMTSVKKSSGNMYRLGGDEFALLVPVDCPFNMVDLSKKLEKSLRKIHLLIGISFGRTIVTKFNCNSTRKAEESMSIADSEMYEMKRETKKRIF